MFAASMQSQQALASQRQNLQEVAAGYERRLQEAEHVREREVATLHARATQAMRELQARHAQEMQRMSQEVEAEREQVRVERGRAAELQATIDQLRAERLQRREEHVGEEAIRELDAARADARKWRTEVDVLTSRLEAREKLFQADIKQREAVEQERDAQLTKAQAAWKERLADVEAQLEKAWAEQTRLQEDLVRGGGGGSGPTAAAAPATFPDTFAFDHTSPPMTEAAPASASNLWGEAVANTGPLDGGAAFGAGGGGGWPGDSSGGGDGGFGVDTAGGWAGISGSAEASRSAAKKEKKRSKSGSRKKDMEQGGFADSGISGPGGSGPLPSSATTDFGHAFSFGGNGGGSSAFGGHAAADPSQVSELVSMGFAEEKVQEVLSQVNGDMDQAIARLLGGA